MKKVRGHRKGSKAFRPPAHLSESAKKLWRGVVPSRARSAERLALIQTALEAFDRAQAARRVLKREGMTIKTKRTGMVHRHPLVDVEHQNRRLFIRCWTRLRLGCNLEIDTEVELERWP